MGFTVPPHCGVAIGSRIVLGEAVLGDNAPGVFLESLRPLFLFQQAQAEIPMGLGVVGFGAQRAAEVLIAVGGRAVVDVQGAEVVQDIGVIAAEVQRLQQILFGRPLEMQAVIGVAEVVGDFEHVRLELPGAVQQGDGHGMDPLVQGDRAEEEQDRPVVGILFQHPKIEFLGLVQFLEVVVGNGLHLNFVYVLQRQVNQSSHVFSNVSRRKKSGGHCAPRFFSRPRCTEP